MGAEITVPADCPVPFRSVNHFRDAAKMIAEDGKLIFHFHRLVKMDE